MVIYRGRKPIKMSDLLIRPTHSIIRQSFASKERANKDPLNGDGFGIGWYDDEAANKGEIRALETAGFEHIASGTLQPGIFLRCACQLLL